MDLIRKSSLEWLKLPPSDSTLSKPSSVHSKARELPTTCALISNLRNKVARLLTKLVWKNPNTKESQKNCQEKKRHLSVVTVKLVGV